MRAEIRRLRNWILVAFLLIGGMATAGIIEGYDVNGKKKAFNNPLPVALDATSTGYDSNSSAFRGIDVNPPWEQYIPLVIASEVDKANGTYYYNIPMNSSRELGCTVVITGTVTITVEGTNEPGCAPGDCTAWPDVTNEIYGSANYTATDGLVDTGRVAGQHKYLRFKVITAGGGTDDYEIYCKRLY